MEGARLATGEQVLRLTKNKVMVKALFESILLIGTLICFVVVMYATYLEEGPLFLIWLVIIVLFLYISGEQILFLIRRSYPAEFILTPGTAVLILRGRPFKEVTVGPSLEVEIIKNDEISGISFYEDDKRTIVIHKKWGWTDEDISKIIEAVDGHLMAKGVQIGDELKLELKNE